MILRGLTCVSTGSALQLPTPVGHPPSVYLRPCASLRRRSCWSPPGWFQGFVWRVEVGHSELSLTSIHMHRRKRVSVQQPSRQIAVLGLQISWEVDAGAADEPEFSNSKAAGWLAARCSRWRRNEAMICRFFTRSALKQHWNFKKASPSTRRTWDPLSWTEWTTAGGVHRFLLQLSVRPWRQHPPDGRCCRAN